MSSFAERAQREKEQYNKGINRRVYDNVLSHAKYYYRLRREQILREQLQYANRRRIRNMHRYIIIVGLDKRAAYYV